MPIDEELKEQCVVKLYLKNPTVVRQAPRKIPSQAQLTKGEVVMDANI